MIPMPVFHPRLDVTMTAADLKAEAARCRAANAPQWLPILQGIAELRNAEKLSNWSAVVAQCNKCVSAIDRAMDGDFGDWDWVPYKVGLTEAAEEIVGRAFRKMDIAAREAMRRAKSDDARQQIAAEMFEFYEGILCGDVLDCMLHGPLMASRLMWMGMQ